MLVDKENTFIAWLSAFKLRFRHIPSRGSHRPDTEGSRMIACARCSARCCTAGLVNAVGGKQKLNVSDVAPDHARHLENKTPLPRIRHTRIS